MQAVVSPRRPRRCRQRTRRSRRPISRTRSAVPSARIVVDENNLPAHRVERRIQQVDERPDIVPLVERRNDHSQFRPRRDWAFLRLRDSGEIFRSSEIDILHTTASPRIKLESCMIHGCFLRDYLLE